MTSIYDFEATNIKGETVSLSQFRGKTLMIVNTASACGFTSQYKELQELYTQYKDKGLEILAFPCNQFGSQESGTNEEIAQFCNLRFNVTFPLFSKIDVNGKDAHPLFNYLKKELSGVMGLSAIKWNFTKFVIDKDGKPFKRYAPQDKPKKIMEELAPMLK